MDTFSAIAEPTRRNILELLANSGQMSASDIYEKFTSSPPAISQHLKILKEANLITVEKKAQKRIYKINPEAIDEVEEWLQKMKMMWNKRFDRLEKILEEEKRKGVKKK